RGARRRRRAVFQADRREVQERRVPPRSARGDRQGPPPRGGARRQAVARGDRQARGVREGDGGEGPRARAHRRERELGAVAAREDTAARAGRRDEGGGGGGGARPPPLPVGGGERREKGEGHPPPARRKGGGPHPGERQGRKVKFPGGHRPAALRVRRREEVVG